MNYETLIETQKGVTLQAISSYTVNLTYSYNIDIIESFSFMHNSASVVFYDLTITDNILSIELRGGAGTSIDFTFIVTIRGN